MSWRQWWRASWTGRQLASLSHALQGSAQNSRFLRWLSSVQRDLVTDRQRLGALALAVCAITVLAATLLRPELRALLEVGVRAAVLAGVVVVIQRIIAP